MNQEHVKQLLTQLHTELAGTEEVDGELKSLLQNLNKDIHQVLNGDQQHDDPVYAALSERSVSLSAKFAAEHPKLEPVLRELASMLAKIGV
ncbi:DUF4404 family protein [Undibacterium sp. Dicai25W]|uniref:DUF4404 family protein n=1 Tax=Undibacterium sp. Dicai25W TaxID=3413034 RepID=UPI003BF06555